MLKLLIHRIPTTVTCEMLHEIVPGDFTIEEKVLYISMPYQLKFNHQTVFLVLVLIHGTFAESSLQRKRIGD